MSTAFTRLFVLIVFLLFMLQERNASDEPASKDRLLYLKLCRELVNDASRKALSVWELRNDFSKYKTFTVGEIVFTIRSKFAGMIRVLLNAQAKASQWTITNMIRNITSLQRMAQELYIYQDELIKFDNEAQHDSANDNLTRFKTGGNCQVAGTMYMPESVMRPKNYSPYRRMLESRGIMKAYQQKEPVKPSVYVAEELGQTLNVPGVKRRSTHHQNMDFMNMAPDL